MSSKNHYEAETRPNGRGGWEVAEPGSPAGSGIGNYATEADAFATACYNFDADRNRGLFDKPRTWTLHGIKLGLNKGKGRVEFDDEEKVIAKLKARFGDLSPEVDRCVEVIEKLDADGLRELDGKALAAIGVTIEGTGDVVYIRAVDTAVDKLVKRLLKEGSREKEE